MDLHMLHSTCPGLRYCAQQTHKVRIFPALRRRPFSDEPAQSEEAENVHWATLLVVDESIVPHATLDKRVNTISIKALRALYCSFLRCTRISSGNSSNVHFTRTTLPPPDDADASIIIQMPAVQYPRSTPC
ncbi:hypothetical protein CBL_07990 [Carabus blaptoides fortunei]